MLTKFTPFERLQEILLTHSLSLETWLTCQEIICLCSICNSRGLLNTFFFFFYTLTLFFLSKKKIIKEKDQCVWKKKCKKKGEKNHLIYFSKNFLWKSLRIVSLINRFFVSGSSLAWLRNTTSSSHLKKYILVFEKDRILWLRHSKITCSIDRHVVEHENRVLKKKKKDPRENFFVCIRNHKPPFFKFILLPSLNCRVSSMTKDWIAWQDGSNIFFAFSLLLSCFALFLLLPLSFYLF